MNTDLHRSKRDLQTYNIIGAAMAVHNELGSGFFESVYQEALSLEFGMREIPHEKEVKLPVYYREKELNQFYVADFICYETIIIETIFSFIIFVFLL